MKRLWVSESGRGTGAGKALATAIVEAAKSIGHDEMWPDTLWAMKAANGTYESIWFQNMEPYYDVPPGEF